jgi:hypothetical protein
MGKFGTMFCKCNTCRICNDDDDDDDDDDKVKIKGKVHHRTGHEGPKGE